MFYSKLVLSKKAPLGKIWMAAYLADNKIPKETVISTDIKAVADSIRKPQVPMALRMSGPLMLGVVRVYGQKVHDLSRDCHTATTGLRSATRAPGAVDLPPNEAEARDSAITLASGDGLDIDDGLLAASLQQGTLLAAEPDPAAAAAAVIDMQDVDGWVVFNRTNSLLASPELARAAAARGLNDTSLSIEVARGEGAQPRVSMTLDDFGADGAAGAGNAAGEADAYMDFGGGGGGNVGDYLPADDPSLSAIKGATGAAGLPDMSLTPVRLGAGALDATTETISPYRLPATPAGAPSPAAMAAAVAAATATAAAAAEQRATRKRKREPIIDAVVQLSSDAMRMQLTDASDLLVEPMYAPPTKKAMRRYERSLASAADVFSRPFIAEAGISPELLGTFRSVLRVHDARAADVADARASARAAAAAIEGAAIAHEAAGVALNTTGGGEADAYMDFGGGGGGVGDYLPLDEAPAPAAAAAAADGDVGSLAFERVLAADAPDAAAAAESGESSWSQRTIHVLEHVRARLADAGDEALTLAVAFAGARRPAAAGAFFELLVLAAHGRLAVQQTEAYGDITLAPGDAFNDAIPVARVAAQ